MKGIVVKSTGSWYSVRMDSGEVMECRIKGKFRMKGIKTTNPVAVGDVVEVEVNPDGAVINRIEDRKNYIIRKSTNLSKEAHIIAANVDQAVLVVTVNHPVTSTVFIDRFLASVEAYRIPVLLVFNKIDAYSEDDLMLLGALTRIYMQVGYECFHVSSLTGEGMEDVVAALKDKVTVFSGLSGVGKSSLINIFQPDANMETGTISEKIERGKHTTRHSELICIEEDTYIMDTPGFSSLYVNDFEKEELKYYFPEFELYEGQCRFNGCDHIHEPGCAVKEAVEKGKIHAVRYEDYKELYEELKNKRRY